MPHQVGQCAHVDVVVEAEDIFQGKVKAVVIPEERALDIDTELDFAIAELVLKKLAA